MNNIQEQESKYKQIVVFFTFHFHPYSFMSESMGKQLT
jgi:hypothetical protein